MAQEKISMPCILIDEGKPVTIERHGQQIRIIEDDTTLAFLMIPAEYAPAVAVELFGVFSAEHLKRLRGEAAEGEE